VSWFAVFGDALKPRSFSGLLGAAPSVALATISLTALKKGQFYASMEARSMVLGAIAFLVYAAVVSEILMRKKWPVVATAATSLVIWVGCALGLWYSILR